MPDPRTELRAAALAATPGPWAETCMGSEGYHIHEQTSAATIRTRRKRVALCTYEDWETDKANAGFIAAASPAAVLALLDDLAAVEAERDRAVRERNEATRRAEWVKADARVIDERHMRQIDVNQRMAVERDEAHAELADARRTLDEVRKVRDAWSTSRSERRGAHPYLTMSLDACIGDLDEALAASRPSPDTTEATAAAAAACAACDGSCGVCPYVTTEARG